MPSPNNDFDRGSIFGNLLNDIKHIPDRTIQQSRALRGQSQMQAIQEEAQRRAVRDSIDQNAINSFQNAVPDADVPLMPDGRPDRRVMAGLMKAAGIKDKRALIPVEADEAAATTTARLDAEKKHSDAIIDAQRGASGSPLQAPGGSGLLGVVGRNVGAGIAKLLGGGGTGSPAAAAPDSFVQPSAPAAAPAPVMNDEQQRMAFRNQQALALKGQAKQEATDIEAGKQRAVTTEKERDEFRSFYGRDPQPGELDPSGALNATGLNGILKAKQAAAKAKDDEKMSTNERNARAAVELGIKAGTIPEDERDQALAMASTQLMGRFPAFPSNERDAAVGNATQLQALDQLMGAIKASQDSGHDDFGPIANNYHSLMGKLTGDPSHATAAKVNATYNKALAQQAFSEGGKQLTGTELGLEQSQIGKPTDNNFPKMFADYRDRRRGVAELQLSRLMESPHRYTPEGQAAIKQLKKALGGMDSAAPAAPAAPQAAQQPVGDFAAAARAELERRNKNKPQ